ncbi:MAG: B12-binding domain-containing radical SAM protein [Candidatus Woesearchaeota archaeon]
MKVLVVNPPNKPFTEKSLLIEPIDVLSIATYVKNLFHDVKVVDMDIKHMNPPNIERIISAYNPQITIVPFDYHIPLHKPEAIPGILQIAQLAKKYGSKTIITGKTSKQYPKYFIDNGFDVTIDTHAELVLESLLNLKEWSSSELLKIGGISFKIDDGIINYKLDGNIMKNIASNKINLNLLPIPDRNLLNIYDYSDTRAILSSRGCSIMCDFCPNPDYWGPWRGRLPENVVDEIEMLVSKYSAKKIMFLDDNATADKQRMTRISQMILDRGIDSMYGCLSTVGLGYEKSLLELMYKAGFRWLHYGAESGSDKVLSKNCEYKDVRAIRYAIDQSKDIGFRVRTSWIYDLPGTDKKAIEDTNNLILETEPQEIRIHYLAPRVGTKFHTEQNDFSPKSQYIHNNKSLGISGCDNKELTNGIDNLLDKLLDKGYVAVYDTKDWLKISEIDNPKFISFCPSKYGLGWRR